MKWDLCIGTWGNGHKTEDGDIIAVRPSGWQWGKKELTQYLIVVVDGLSKEEANNLVSSQYEDGDKEKPIVNKRRFKIPLDIIGKGWVPDLDITAAKDKEIKYQPFLDSNLTIDMTEKVAVCFDKQLSRFKYEEEKSYAQ